MKINDLVQESHGAAKEKGWWEKPKSPLEVHMLCVSELAEATEEARSGTPKVYFMSDGNGLEKPEGELIELADTINSGS